MAARRRLVLDTDIAEVGAAALVNRNCNLDPYESFVPKPSKVQGKGSRRSFEVLSGER